MKNNIIIQARLGSTRLPGKIVKPFYKDKSILEVIIENCKNYFDATQIILATSKSNENDQLEAVAQKHQIHFFQGDENNVLQRFIDCANHYNINRIVRICADNPFLMPEFIKPLLDQLETYHYASYQWPDETPVMLSHIGLFAEAFKLSFLEQINLATNDPLYQEHVTNYLYANRHDFNAIFLPIPKELNGHSNIRLTIDTKEDFETAQEIYAYWKLLDHQNLASLLQCIQNYPLLLDRMQKEIEKNAK